jgi:general secretion pathway protein L
MFSELLNWWLRRMSEVLPERWTARRLNRQDALIAEFVHSPGGNGSTGHDVALHLWQRRRRRIVDLGLFDLALPEAANRIRTLTRKLRGAETVLRVNEATLLERDVELPLAAEPELERVLGYEMDRLTPFRVEDVIWGFETLTRDRARGRITLRLSLAPRAPIAAALEDLQRHGLVVSALQIGHGDPPRSIRVPRPPTAAERRLRRLTVVAAAVCGLLLAAVAATPVIRQSLALAQVEDRIEALRPLTTQAEALRRRIAQTKATGDVVAEQRNHSGDAVAVLAALTEILPDDTVLTELTLNQRKLGLRGRSAAASRLIGLLATDPTIRNAAFTAPVTRGDGSLREQFALQADVAP